MLVASIPSLMRPKTALCKGDQAEFLSGQPLERARKFPRLPLCRKMNENASLWERGREREREREREEKVERETLHKSDFASPAGGSGSVRILVVFCIVAHYSSP